MSQKRRKFSDAFKQKVLHEVSGGKSVAEVTRQYSLSKNAVYEWQSRAAADGMSVAVPQRELSDLHDKIAALERVVGRLTLENDLLKKLRQAQSRTETETETDGENNS